MKAVIRIFAIFCIAIFAGITAGYAFDINPIYSGIASAACSFLPLGNGSLNSFIFTAPGGVATPFTVNFKGLPQLLTFNNVVPLTSLRIETKKQGVVHDWLAASIAAINGYALVGAQAANIIYLRLANGYMPDEEVTLSGVTSAAGAVNFFGMSDKIGTNLFKTTNAQILANNPTYFDNFTAIWVPTMAAGDTCEIEYRAGHKETLGIAELAAQSSAWQEVPAIMVNNQNAYIKTVRFTCAAATPAYVLSIIL